MRGYVVALAILFGFAAVALFVPAQATAQDDVTVEIVVIDDSGETVSGVEVTVAWDGENQTKETLPDGSAAFGVPQGADLEVTIDHGAYVRNFPYEIDNVQTAEGEQRLREEVPVSHAGTLELQVRQGDEPVEDVTINLQDTEAARWVEGVKNDDGTVTAATGSGTTQNFQTDEDGRVVINRLEQKDYRIFTSKSGYLRTETPITLAESQQRENISVETARVQVDFYVEDHHYDPPEPLEGAEIRIEERGITLETFSDGGQDQRLPVNSNYEIEVSKENYSSVSRTLRVDEEPKTFNVSISRIAKLKLDLLNNQVITGQTTRATVTNAYDEPIEGATIYVDGEEVGETDATGSFDVQLDEDGEHEVRASFDNLEDSAQIEAFDPDAEDVPEDIQNGTNQTDGDGNDSEGDDNGDEEGPGFGVALAVLALLASVAFLHGSRR